MSVLQKRMGVMVRAQKCECGEFYVFNHFGGPFPGGKEREEEFCPHCQKLVFSEMTSGCTSIRPATSCEILEWENSKALAVERQEKKSATGFEDLLGL